MKIPVGKRYGDARWKGLGMGDYECTNCYTVVGGDHRIYCPKCGAQMYNDGDLIYNEETGEACIVKLGQSAL